MRRLFAVFAFASACERAPTPEPPCLADELPRLEPGWTPHPDCTADHVECREACRKGDAHTCVAIAHALVPTDENAARDLYERACKLGLATGCTNWAASVWTNPHLISWRCLYRVFDKACDSDDPWACGMRGRLLIEDGKSPIDVSLGLLLVDQACAEAGATCRMLARYVEHGRLGPVDRDRVSNLLRRSCDGGDRSACGHSTVEESDRASR